MVVLELVRMAVEPMGNEHASSFDIDGLDRADKYAGATQERAQRTHNMRDVQIARCHFVQHRREKEEVLLTDQRDLYGQPLAGKSLQMTSGIDAAKTATQNHDSNWKCRHIAWMPTLGGGVGE
jgi:hypothetical protein